VNKSKSINYNYFSRTNIALFCVLGMIAGFLVSRVVLSVSMLVFCITCLYGVHPKRYFQNKWWLLGLCWVSMYAVSYFWSSDSNSWWVPFSSKIPFLFLPLAFGFLPAFSQNQLKLFSIIVSLMLIAGAVYSSLPFFSSPDFYANAYIKSKVLRTPARGDHIRFSLTIALFIVWCVYSWPIYKSKILKAFIGFTLMLLSVYLHLLAARTGLIVLYLFVILWGVFIVARKNIMIAVSVFVLLASAAFISVNYIPTLKSRFGYLSYTLILYNRGEISGIYSDMGRLISYDIAFKLIKENPIVGTGVGDMYDEMHKGYAKWYPDINHEIQLLPHNQFVVVTLGCGIIGLLLFTVWVFAPLRQVKKGRDGFFFFIVWLALFIPLLVEPAFEIQFGVFVYLFFILWQKHAIETRTIAKAIE